MAAQHLITAAAVVTLIMTSSLSDANTKDIKVAYYSNAFLRCHENKTDIPNSRVFWITPDAEVVEANKPLPSQILLVNNTISMINVTKVDDAQFGYYTCVMIREGTNDVTLMRWGLNVDGADFSELEDQYRHSAIVGAIAAGVMLVLVGGACIIWNYRYSRRSDSSERSSSIEDDLKKPATHQIFSNQGYDSTPVTMADIEMADSAEEKANGSAAVKDGEEKENGGSAVVSSHHL